MNNQDISVGETYFLGNVIICWLIQPMYDDDWDDIYRDIINEIRSCRISTENCVDAHKRMS